MANNKREQSSSTAISRSSWVESLIKTIADEVDVDRYHDFGRKLGVPREMSEVNVLVCWFIRNVIVFYMPIQY